MNDKERIVWSVACGLVAVYSCVAWLQTYSAEGHLIALDATISVVLFPVLAAAPWIRHFSLRTLLIAMTLVCVGLGFAVWSVR